ncbi:MAG: hypothetical protein WBW03_29585 [Silvibacterium sp.]|jgi:hypothetical protein
MSSQLPPIYYIIFTGVTAAAVLLQTLILLAAFLAVRRIALKLQSTTDEIKKHAIPTIILGRQLLEDVSPKLKIAATNLVEASHSLRHQAKHVSTTVDDLLDKTTVQTARVDEIVTASLDTVIHATRSVQQAVAVPIQWASALFAGLKAGFDVLRGKEPEPRTVTDDFGE